MFISDDFRSHSLIIITVPDVIWFYVLFSHVRVNGSLSNTSVIPDRAYTLMDENRIEYIFFLLRKNIFVFYTNARIILCADNAGFQRT